MADKELLRQLTYGVDSWNQWRRQYRNLRPDLTEANLKGADLTGIDFSFANLTEANLCDCILTEANLDATNLTAAKLEGANLREAECWHTNFWGADMRRCILSSATLSEVILKETLLTGANFSHARFSDLLIAQVDWSTVIGVETIIHRGPSAVDLTSVILPGDESTRLSFLRGVGFSDAMISSAALEVKAPRCFLSYASQDEALARRIHDDLQNNGVRCWMMPHLHPETDADEDPQPDEMLVLILSEHAVGSSWADFEVRVMLNSEAKGRLFALRIDEAVMQTEQDWAMRLRESRPIADWTRRLDEAAYQQVFTELLRQALTRT